MNCRVNVTTLVILSAAKDLTPDTMTYCGLGIRSFASLRTTKRADAR
jgi:hypothetical protein